MTRFLEFRSPVSGHGGILWSLVSLRAKSVYLTYLDAKYEKADLNKLINNLDYLNTKMQSKLLNLLQKYKLMLNGAQGK